MRKNIFLSALALLLFCAYNVHAGVLYVETSSIVVVREVQVSTKVESCPLTSDTFRWEVGWYVTPKTLYDFRYHQYLGGTDVSLASYKVVVMNGGWAVPVNDGNSRGIVTTGLTLELQRSQYVRNFISSILPDFDYGVLNNLAVGGYVGWDFDRNDYRYGSYVGLMFESLSSMFSKRNRK